MTLPPNLTEQSSQAGEQVVPHYVRTKDDLIGIFSRHRTAANLLMVVMLIAGILGLNRMTTQFFPDFGIDIVSVTVSWPGASAADVDTSIVRAIDREVRFIDDVRSVQSSAFEGRANISVEFEPGSDLQSALSNVENAVSQITTLPEDAETPKVQKFVRYDTVLRILVSGPFSETTLTTYAKQIRDGLQAAGVDKVDLGGVRSEEILVEIRPETLRRLKITLDDVARQIRGATEDVPSGEISGRAERQLRSTGRITTAQELAGTDIQPLTNGERLLLRDVATVRDAPDSKEQTYWRDGNRAIALHAMRTPTADSLLLADAISAYLEDVRSVLPPNLNIEVFDVQSDLIRSRFDLLLENGATGLMIVLAVLFLFLNGRVAFWVAAGIPISLAATMFVMWMMGQSINMISMFAIIMVLGLIVDDAIVVGEHAESLHRRGVNSRLASEAGARRMAVPVFCASITTISAFFPLLLITDIIGTIIRTIPLIVICVIIASLIECFLILPSHIRHALEARERPGRDDGLFGPLFGIGLLWLWPLVPVILVARVVVRVLAALRNGFDRGFEAFRDHVFYPLVRLSIRWRYTTVAVAIAAMIGAAAFVAGGRVNFVFFAPPEANTIFVDVEFSAGTPVDRTHRMLQELQRSIKVADRKLTGGDGELVKFYFGILGVGVSGRTGSTPVTGDHVAGMFVELHSTEQRTVQTSQFIAAWDNEIRRVPGLQKLTIKAAQGGPPGRDMDVRLSGASTQQLKSAAEEVKSVLKTIPGVLALEDDLPYGKPESNMELTPHGQALGFTALTVGRQVRNAYEGVVAKRFARGDEEVTIRVRFPEEQLTSESLYSLYLRAPNGSFVPLSSVVTFREQQGFARIRSADGTREVAIRADLNTSVMTTQKAISELERAGLRDIARRHGVEYRFEGRDREQRRTFRDMAIGAVVGLTLIFITLAWVFSSYTRPLVVMSVIPIGFIGAVVGHYLLGYDLTILSMMSIVGLSGIIVNSSIILVSVIKERMDNGEPEFEAIAQGARDRLRAVILTALTTIGGLTPLLFAADLQAQFLVPMGITIVFGLMSTTLLVLFVVPSLIAIQTDLGRVFLGWRRQTGDVQMVPEAL